MLKSIWTRFPAEDVWPYMREKMPTHSMTGPALTAVAVLRPVIGLTVIGTVFQSPWALAIGHNAAVDLAAAVRWKPCNSSLPCLPFSSYIWTLTWSFMSWVNFMALGPLIPGHTPTCDFRNTRLSMRKWALHSSFLKSFFFFPFLLFLTIHVFTQQQHFAAAGPLPWGKVRLEVSTHLNEDHTYTHMGMIARC